MHILSYMLVNNHSKVFAATKVPLLNILTECVTGLGVYSSLKSVETATYDTNPATLSSIDRSMTICGFEPVDSVYY